MTCSLGEIGCASHPLALAVGGAELCKQPGAISIFFFLKA